MSKTDAATTNNCPVTGMQFCHYVDGHDGKHSWENAHDDALALARAVLSGINRSKWDELARKVLAGGDV